jgi:hypothetical protein
MFVPPDNEESEARFFSIWMDFDAQGTAEIWNVPVSGTGHVAADAAAQAERDRAVVARMETTLRSLI